MDKLKKDVDVHLSNTEAILMTKMHSAALFLFFPFFNNVAKPSLSPVHELPGSCNL